MKNVKVCPFFETKEEIPCIYERNKKDFVLKLLRKQLARFKPKHLDKSKTASHNGLILNTFNISKY